jgi:hypothetical protein
VTTETEQRKAAAAERRAEVKPDELVERIAGAPQDITEEDIERRFTYHRPEGAKIDDHNDVRAMFKEFASALKEFLPPGREKSLAFTKLEEAANWAHAAIARDGK